MLKYSLVLLAVMLVILIPSRSATVNAQNCTSPNWEGRFYNNTDFADSPIQQQCSPVVDFDWGLGAPAADVAIDNFSVRWTSTQTFPAAGSYLFTLNVQDGARLFVNGTPLINAMDDVEQTQTLTATYNVPTAGATAFITIEMVNFTGNANLKLVWALASGGVPQSAAPQTSAPAASGFTGTSSGTSTTAPNAEVVTVASTGGGQPWTVEYFNNLDVDGDPIVTESEVADGISRNYGLEAPAEGVPADGWSARWTRSIDFAEGVYTFTLRADDGAKVSINDTQILEQPEFAAGASYTVAVQIPAGEHVLKVEFFDIQEAADLFLTWNPPVGTTLLPDGCNGATAGINGSALPCPDQQAQSVFNTTGVPSAANNNPTMSVVVRAGPLYFRPSPNRNGEPYGFIHRGDSFTAVGRSADNIWIQLQANGQTGWSMTEFLTLSGDINTLAITDGTVAPANTASVGTTSGTGVTVVGEDNPNEDEGEGETTQQALSEPAFTGVQATALGNMRMRAAPNDDADRVLSVPWGAVVDVIGRTGDGRWLQIALDGVQGWSSAAWYEIVQGDLSTVPITQ